MLCSVLQGVSAVPLHPKHAIAGKTVQKRAELCFLLETPCFGLGTNKALRRKTLSKPAGNVVQRRRAISCKSAEAGDNTYRSLLPPFRTRGTISQETARGVWTFEQPMGYFTALIGNPFPAKGLAYFGQRSVSRMTAVRLRDGKLLVYSPLALTEELRQAVAKLGKVAHVVLPCTSPEHWYYAPRFLDAFPDAEVWAAPFLLTSEKGIPIAKDVRTPELERLKSTRDPKDLGETPPSSWRNQFELALFTGGPLFTEVALFHKSSGCLLVSDSLLYLDDDSTSEGLSRSLASVNGVYNTMGAPVVRNLFRRKRRQANIFAKKLLSWPVKRVIPTHGAIVSSSPKNLRRMLRTVFDLEE